MRENKWLYFWNVCQVQHAGINFYVRLVSNNLDVGSRVSLTSNGPTLRSGLFPSLRRYNFPQQDRFYILCKIISMIQILFKSKNSFLLSPIIIFKSKCIFFFIFINVILLKFNYFLPFWKFFLLFLI